MNILVDLTQIPLVRTGVGVYAESLIRELAPLIGPEDVLFLLIQDDEQVLFEIAAGRPNIRILLIPSRWFRNRILLLAFEQLVLPFVLLIHHIDLIHSLHYTHPLASPALRVVTVHDLTFLLYPELHTGGRRFVMPFFIRRAMKHAEAVIFDSDSTRTDAERLLPGGRGLRSVVPLGVDRSLSGEMDWGEVSEVLRALKVTRPFLLYVGTIEPRKNILRMIQAFELIAGENSEVSLVLAGRLGWDYDGILHALKESRYADRMFHVGFVSDKAKKALLRGCEVLVYPSLYEGFGLPVLEAMAAGAPVITSRISSLPEVAGEAALLIDPYAVSELADAMKHVLGNAAERTRMQRDGTVQAEKFTWRATAELTYGVYRSLFETRKTDHV